MKKYYLKVFGCQMNESDSQRIASFLEQQHYQNTDKMENADLIVVTACSVRQSAIDRIFGLSKKFKKIKAKKILTGCVIKSDKPKFLKFFDEVLSIDELLGKNYLELQPKHSNQKSAYVPIMTGCNNFCTYCAVPYTRGREISRPAKNIIKEVKKIIRDGYKEIVLLGQNVNSYYGGQSSAFTEDCPLVTFPKLLKMISDIPGDFVIKFLTSHPKDFSDELIDVIAKSPKISKEIHLPVQSGDNEILRKMNRGYTAEKYLNLIQKIRTKIPGIRFTTDVIVGFPGETKEQFENTVKLFKKIGFDVAYINKYSARPGTAAAQFKDDVPLTEKKRRWEVLEELVNKRHKLIVVLGPTASGKSDLAIGIAKKFNCEIISADSKQIYKGVDIGTGKITKNNMHGIPHHLLDVTTPEKQFSITEYKKLADTAIKRVIQKNKTPILCGGTGFYIQAITDNIIIPEVRPDWKLRKKLEKKTEKELFKQLKKLDPNRAKNIDAKNKRRLIRAIEIVLKTGKPVPPLNYSAQGGPAVGWDILYLGIKKSLPELKQRINKRVDKMIKIGLEKEVEGLVKKYGWTMILKNTIGYKEFSHYAKASRDKQKIKDDIKLHTYQYAKKQMTWFNKYPGKKINWVKNPAQAEKLVKEFLPR
jgi:tRNA dimethylallyltransferase